VATVYVGVEIVLNPFNVFPFVYTPARRGVRRRTASHMGHFRHSETPAKAGLEPTETLGASHP